MRDFIEILKAFGLFASCLVIGYGGLFLFFYYLLYFVIMLHIW